MVVTVQNPSSTSEPRKMWVVFNLYNQEQYLGYLDVNRTIYLASSYKLAANSGDGVFKALRALSKQCA